MYGVSEIVYRNNEQVENEQIWADIQESKVDVLAYQRRFLPDMSPLETLVKRMRKCSPMALDVLVNTFCPMPGEKNFIALVNEYLPAFAADILGEGQPYERIENFIQYFGRNYFPLNEYGYDGDEAYIQFLDSCPFQSFAISSMEYESIPNDGAPDIKVLAFIMENPWSDTDRPAYVEAACDYLPKKTVKLVPKNGFGIYQMQEWLKGTKFEPVAFYGQVVQNNTGNEFMDCGDIEDHGVEFPCAWNRATIDAMTENYKEFRKWLKVWDEFRKWFSKDLAQNALELINLLNERKAESENPEKKTLYHLFARDGEGRPFVGGHPVVGGFMSGGEPRNVARYDGKAVSLDGLLALPAGDRGGTLPEWHFVPTATFDVIADGAEVGTPAGAGYPGGYPGGPAGLLL